MRKSLITILLVVLTLTVVVGCGEVPEDFTCDFCKNKVHSVKYEVNYKGQDIEVCEDCYKGFKDLGIIK